MRLSQQEIMNAICVHIAERRQIKPEEVQVQLMYEDDLGFSAEIFVGGRNQILIEGNMLEAIERYVLNEYQLRIFRTDIVLDIDEEMFATVHTAQNE